MRMSTITSSGTRSHCSRSSEASPAWPTTSKPAPPAGARALAEQHVVVRERYADRAPPSNRDDYPRRTRDDPSERGLTSRVVVACGVLLVIVAAAFAVLIVAIDGMRDSATEADHSQALTAAGALERRIVDLDGPRGFVITHRGASSARGRPPGRRYPRTRAPGAAHRPRAAEAPRAGIAAAAART